MFIVTAVILYSIITLAVAMSGLLSKPVHPDVAAWKADSLLEEEDDDADLLGREYDQDESFLVDPRTYLDSTVLHSRDGDLRQIPGAESMICQPVPTTVKRAHIGKEEKRNIEHIRLSQTFVDIEFARLAVVKDCGCRNAYCLRQPDGKQHSLLTGVVDKSIELVKWCRRSIEPLTQRGKYNFIHGKFLESIKETGRKRSLDATAEVRNPSDKFLHRFIIGDRSAGFPEIVVCRQAFMRAYGITTWMMDSISRHVKAGQTQDCPAFSDKTRDAEISVADIKKIAAKHGLKMDTRQAQAGTIPNTRQHIVSFMWMETYFNQYGDHIPNSNGQIHLDFIEKTTLYEEYCRDVSYAHPDAGFMTYPRFCELWKSHFKHVSIRKHKGVTGKCSSCSLMTGLRYSCTDPKRRQLLVELHALHRSMFMQERMCYYDRIHYALSHPDTCMSCISDGMAQQHCILPHMAGIDQFGCPLTQHLQGVLEHGQLFTIYRTFHTVGHGADMQVYVLLSQLEQWYQRNGRFPELVYWQVDGGPENANKYILGICELLVHLDIGIKRIVFTRLPVGHTHEDIDSKFAKIWVGLRCHSIYTPQQYKAKLEEIFASSRIKCKVVDVFAVPDYHEWLERHIDSEFGKCHKGVQTMHQWQFEKVTTSVHFPMGVKTSHKLFSADTAYEIVVSSFPHENECGRLLGLKAIETLSFWGPVDNPKRPDGMYLLRSYPSDKIAPKALKIDSLASLEKTVRDVRKYFGESHATTKAWVDWATSSAPTSDDVYEYIKGLGGMKKFHRPLNDFLVVGQVDDKTRGTASMTRPPIVPSESLPVRQQKIPRYKQGNSVDWKEQDRLEEPRVRVDEEGVEDSGFRYREYAAFTVDYESKDVTAAQITNSLKLRNLPHTGDKKAIGHKLADSDLEELFQRFRPLLVEKQQGVDWLIYHAEQPAFRDQIVVEVTV